MKITTIKELKNFLNNFNEDTQITFADGECMPCKPWVWEIDKIDTFLENNITEECRQDIYKDMQQMNIQPTDIVIHAEF